MLYYEYFLCNWVIAKVILITNPTIRSGVPQFEGMVTYYGFRYRLKVLFAKNQVIITSLWCVTTAEAVTQHIWPKAAFEDFMSS